MDSTEWLYHGTSSEYLEAILRHGITVGNYWGSYRSAHHYGSICADDTGTDLVIFRKPLNSFNLTLLGHDDNTVIYPPTRLLESSESALFVRWLNSARNWRACLEIYESVRYFGNMHVRETDVVTLQGDQDARKTNEEGP